MSGIQNIVMDKFRVSYQRIDRSIYKLKNGIYLNPDRPMYSSSRYLNIIENGNIKDRFKFLFT